MYLLWVSNREYYILNNMEELEKSIRTLQHFAPEKIEVKVYKLENTVNLKNYHFSDCKCEDCKYPWS